MEEYIIGIDLGGTNIKGAIFNSKFQSIIENSILTEAVKGPDYVLNRIKVFIEDLIRKGGVSFNSIKSMGMGIPGLLDPNEGLSIFSPNFPGWENIHVVNSMKKHFDFPVFIDNDVRVNLYGEWKYGAGKGYKNIVLITLGTGLGSGIVNDEKVVHGTTFSAGEIGHMNMYRNGRPCRCGSSGCLGRYVSAVGMVNTFKEKLVEGRTSIVQKWVSNNNEQIEAFMISEAYDQGDLLAKEVLNETGTLLGFGLANIINLLNPEIVIVGGGMSAAGDRLLNPVRDAVNKHTLKLSGQACRVIQGNLGSRAGMIGAAVYSYEKCKIL